MKNLLTALANGIFTITVNRPDKMNALNIETFSELDQVLTEAEKNPEIKVLLITGAGEKAFVAGADISELATISKEDAMRLAANGQRIFQRIEDFSKPVVAMVNGFALGGGCELAMACHIRYASDNAKFGLPEVTLGILPGYGGTQRMVHLAGKGKALELMFTGNMISAAEAKEIGLVNQVTPAAELQATCEKLAQRIAQLAPIAQQHIIKAANTAVYNPQKGYEQEVNSFGALTLTEDFREGTKAFLEKRKAEFKGK